jgi:hypothetical protein
VLTVGYNNSAFLKHHLPNFAKANPQIEIIISPRPHKHPIIRGEYSTSLSRARTGAHQGIQSAVVSLTLAHSL